MTTPHLSQSAPRRSPIPPGGRRAGWPDSNLRFLPAALVVIGLLMLVLGPLLDGRGGNPFDASATLEIPVAESRDSGKSAETLRSAQVELESAERNARRGAPGTTVDVLGATVNGVFQITATGDTESRARRALDEALVEIEDRRAEELAAQGRSAKLIADLQLTTAIAELQEMREAAEADEVRTGITRVEIFRSRSDLLDLDQIAVDEIETVSRLARIASLENEIERVSSSVQSGETIPAALNRSDVTTSEIPAASTSWWRAIAAAGFFLAGIGVLLLLWWSGLLGRADVRIALGLALVIFFVWLVFVVWTLSQARQAGIDALGGTNSIRGVSLSLDSLDDLNEVSDELADVDTNLTLAQERLQSRWLAPLTLIPGLGRELRSSRDLVGDAAEVVGEGRNLVISVLRTVERMEAGTADRSGGISELRDAVDHTEAELASLELPGNADLPAQLRTYRDRLDTELTTVEDAVGRAAGGLRMLDEFFGNDGRWLLVGGHSGENHAMTGSFLRFGTVDVLDGEIDVGPLRSIQRGDIARDTDLAALPPGTIESYDPDYQQLFGMLHPEENWIGLGLSPRFDVSAELLVQMWEASTGDEIAGVIYIDSVGLSELVVPLGSVEVDGEVFEPRDVRFELVTGQYLKRRGNSERVGAVLGLAREVIDELTRYNDFAELAPALLRATEQRHLMMWSADPETQAVFEDLEIAGSVQGNSVGLAVSSMNGKWDPFVSVEAELTTACFGETGQVTIDVVVEFEGPPAVADGDELSLNRWGDGETFVGMLGFTIPGASQRVEASLGEFPGAFGPDGPTQMHTGWMKMQPGETREFSITFDTPAFAGIEVLPSGREGATRWTMGDTLWRGLATRSVDVCAPGS